MSRTPNKHTWLSLIDVSGPFLAPPVLDETFPAGMDPVKAETRTRVRQTYEEWLEAVDSVDPMLQKLHQAWIDEVLGNTLELDRDGKGDVLKQNDWCVQHLSKALEEHGVTLAPDMAVVDDQADNTPLMLIQVYEPDIDLGLAMSRQGWVATPADRMVALCRATGCRLGLITNGEQWMFIDAPVGATTSFASWYARIWVQEPETLQAFINLFGLRRFYTAKESRLPALLDRSVEFQDEVTDSLGEQVRRAVEVLIQALDKADQDRHRELLRGISESELYESALTLMMRLVFLLSAEERGLLLMGNERYEAHYALSTLRMQLRAENDEILERRWDAWSRLLALFRVVYGGSEHTDMSLPALGGSLFDPDRFPFLEGRTKDSKWKIDPASPLPIDNRTVLLLLESIQLHKGRTLSYRALDVEQIGYVYEGLLERTVRRAEHVTIRLDGTKNAKNPWVTLPELESAQLDGTESIAELLKERTASSASKIRNALARTVDEELAQNLLTACQGNVELRDRIKPYGHLIDTDPWGYPLVYLAGAFMVRMGSDRRETGTHYTPKSLTEAIVSETLTPIVYVGPAEGLLKADWKLKDPHELLDLKICDPAMGSGAFLVQACRWLAERLVEAWEKEEVQGKRVSADGVVLENGDGPALLPRNTEERANLARRLIAERCLYGVDINPLAVELAKLSIWLITMARGLPFGFLDHNLKHGDSLLGIHRLEQLTQLSMTPNAEGQQQRLFGQSIEQAVNEAVELRKRLRETPIRDIRDVEAMERLNNEANRTLAVPERIADALVAVVFDPPGDGKLENTISMLAAISEEAVNGKTEAIESLKRLSANCLVKDLRENRTKRYPFHWPLEFPEVFEPSRGGFDGIVGNPPFLGGQRITGAAGTAFRDWLVKYIAEGRRGSADLVAYFFLRAWSILRNNGCLGLIAVNTIAEGDTRQVGLEYLTTTGATIYAAYPNEPWPGKAAVVTSRVHLRKGEWAAARNLSGAQAPFISAFLSGQEVWTPKKLKANAGIAFQGSIVLGMGFILSPDQAQSMLDADPKNADVLFPYLSGDDLNSDPEQKPSRWVINFWDWPEERAREYRLPFEWIEQRVKPERQRLNERGEYALRSPLPQRWWQFGEKRPGLYHAIGRGRHFERHPEGWDKTTAQKSRVLFHSFTSKYVCFDFVSNTIVFAGPHNVIASSDDFYFVVLQSNIHEVWARRHTSTMESRLRYAITDCIGNFPFPKSAFDDHRLQIVSHEYLAARKAVSVARNIGYTSVYNLMHDPSEHDDLVIALRTCQRTLDQLVAAAYGWSDIDLRHGFHEVTSLPEIDRIRFTISENARIEVLARLSELNHQRYLEEFAHDVRSEVTPRATRRASRVGHTPDETLQSSLDFGTTHTEETRQPEQAIVDYLTLRPGWQSKADVVAAIGITDSQWNVAIAELLASGRIERQGERRGAKYRITEAGK